MLEQVQAVGKMMEQKGYRGRFQRVDDMRSSRMGRPQAFNDCLTDWLSGLTGEIPGAPVYLAYQFYSGIHKASLECRFEISQSKDRNILVTVMRMRLNGQEQDKWYQFRNNEEVPGFQSLESQFQTEPLWKQHLRSRSGRG